MKSKKLILTLAMTIAMGLGVTAYAAGTETTTTASTHQRVGLSKITGVRGYDYIESVLKNKLGMTDDEIEAGFNSGKTMYDMAKEKGMSEDDFKKALLEEKGRAIDKAVSDGTITKTEGDSAKDILKNNIDSCTGIPGSARGTRGTGHGFGKGHMSTGHSS
jgi:hypothetical protein